MKNTHIVYKYTLQYGLNEFLAPKDMEVIHAGEQAGQICIWAEVEVPVIGLNRDLRIETVKKVFEVINTGDYVPEYSLHVGTVLLDGGRIVQHVYENLTPQDTSRGSHEALTICRLPKIVCICGSSRFADVAAVKAWEFEKQGILALSMHFLPGWYCDQHRKASSEGVEKHVHHIAEKEGVAHILDELHVRKIEMADSIFVVNVEGYIGERTRIEIQIAERLGKPVEYLIKPGTPLSEVPTTVADWRRSESLGRDGK